MSATPVWAHAMVTGHRPAGLGSTADQEWVAAELDRIARKLRDEHATTVGISGMALGADILWARAVLAAGLDLWSYVPFEAQADRWNDHQKATWRELRSQAAHEVVVGDSYSVAMLHARNDAMLNDCDVVVAVWNPLTETGGTTSAVKKALKKGLPVIHVDFVARRVHMLV